jgi:hypothetical protein
MWTRATNTCLQRFCCLLLRPSVTLGRSVRGTQRPTKRRASQLSCLNRPYHTVQDATPAGMPYTSHIYAVELDGDRTYMASTAVYSIPHNTKVSDPRRFLQAGLDLAATRLEGGKHEKQHQGLTALDGLGENAAAVKSAPSPC